MIKTEGGRRTKGACKKSFPDKPLITVVTAVKNAKDLIGETLENVINQSYDNIEYIVIDGDSNDGTADIIKNHEDRIDYWVSEKDHSVYDAMNKAIDLASGEWINFMNAGDRFYSQDTVQLVVEQCTHTKKVDVIYGHHIYGCRPGTLPRKAVELDALWLALKNKNISDSWMKGFPCHQAVFARAEILKKKKYNVKYKWAAEQDFLLSTYAEGHKYLRMDTVLAVYREGGMTFNHLFGSLNERRRIIKKFQGGCKIDAFFLHRMVLSLKWRIVQKIRGSHD